MATYTYTKYILCVNMYLENVRLSLQVFMCLRLFIINMWCGELQNVNKKLFGCCTIIAMWVIDRSRCVYIQCIQLNLVFFTLSIAGLQVFNISNIQPIIPNLSSKNYFQILYFYPTSCPQALVVSMQEKWFSFFIQNFFKDLSRIQNKICNIITVLEELFLEMRESQGTKLKIFTEKCHDASMQADLC